MWICPNCSEEIDTLLYNVSTTGWESGQAYLSENKPKGESYRDIITDHEMTQEDSTEWQNDPEYECSYCNTPISPAELIYKKNDEEKKPEEEIEELTHNIISPTIKFYSKNRQLTDYCIRCKKCKYTFAIDIYDENIINCPKCETPNTIQEFKKLLEKEFPNEETT